MMHELAVVTGTSSGLGRSIAERLTSDGFDVVGIARRSVSLAQDSSASGAYHHLEWDLSDTRGLHALSTKISREFGRPFALINNAAVGTDGLLPTLHDSDIENAVRLNLTSPLILTKYLVRPMLSARRGRIVNIGSIVGRTGFRGLATYAATKAGLEGFTRSLARDVGRRGVTVNLIAPGFMDTAMTSTLSDDRRQRVVARSALQRLCSPHEVAAMVAFLVSEEGAGMSGSIVTVDAGATA